VSTPPALETQPPVRRCRRPSRDVHLHPRSWRGDGRAAAGAALDETLEIMNTADGSPVRVAGQLVLADKSITSDHVYEAVSSKQGNWRAWIGLVVNSWAVVLSAVGRDDRRLLSGESNPARSLSRQALVEGRGEQEVAFDNRVGHVDQLPSVGLGVTAEHVECLVRGDPARTIPTSRLTRMSFAPPSGLRSQRSAARLRRPDPDQPPVSRPGRHLRRATRRAAPARSSATQSAHATGGLY
jgi:hypothetical protein